MVSNHIQRTGTKELKELLFYSWKVSGSQGMRELLDCGALDKQA